MSRAPKPPTAAGRMCGAIASSDASRSVRLGGPPHPALRAPFPHRGGKVWARPWLAGLALLVLTASAARGQELSVRVRVRSEKILVGQGVDVFVDVAAREQRPKLQLPALKGARIWVAEEAFKPLAMTAIGGSVASDNAFSTRLRLVATEPGRLDVPPIVASLDGRTGRSRPLRFAVENPPLAGRPAGFLGGVGDFRASAEVEPARVRLGQEATYRVRVEGPAAWGMTTGPDLSRLQARPIAPRVRRLPDETSDEPPRRTFVYRIRPTKPGATVLPPLAIASYDPRTGGYATRASNGVPIEVVDVPAFDPSGLDYRPPEPPTSPGRVAAGAALIALLLAAAGAWAMRRRLAGRWRRRFPGLARGRSARRFAREAAARLAEAGDDEEESARRAVEALVEYARRGVGRPPGALTPGEAGEAVAAASGSDELGRRASGLAARCDRALFAAREGGASGPEGGRLGEVARELFEELGRPGGGRRVSGRRRSG